MALEEARVTWPVRYQAPIVHTGFRDVALDDNPTILAFGFQATKTGGLEEIELFITALATDEDVTFSIQRPATTGLPDGTAITNSSVAVTSGTLSVGAFAFVFSSSVSVVSGEFYFMVIEWTSTAGNLQIGTTSTANNSAFPNVIGWNGSAWAAQSNIAGLGARFKYDDGSYPFNPLAGAINMDGNAVYNLDNGSNNKQLGVRFRLPFRGRLAGVMCILDNNSNGQGLPGFDLYTDDSDAPSVGGLELLQMGDIGGGEDDMYMSSFGASTVMMFPSPQVIEKDTWSKLVLVAHSAITNQVWTDDFGASAYKMQTLGTTDFDLVHTVNDTSWTHVTDKCPMFTLIFDQIDLDAGGGGAGLILPRSRVINSY